MTVIYSVYFYALRKRWQPMSALREKEAKKKGSHEITWRKCMKKRIIYRIRQVSKCFGKMVKLQKMLDFSS